MSHQMTRSVNGSNAKSRQTVQSYESGWMAHWLRTSSNASAARRDESVSKDDDSKNGSESSNSVKEPIAETKTFEVLNGSVRMRQDYGDTKESRPMFGKSLERGKAIDCSTEHSLRKFHSLGEGTSNKPLDRMKTHSSTHIVPYNDLENHESDKAKAFIRPFSVVPHNQLPYANPRMLDHENREKQRQSDTPVNACFQEFNTPLLFGRDWLQKMQKCSGISFFPPQTMSSEESAFKKSDYDLYSLKKLPNCVHDMETMRICTTVDSVEATPGGCPRFSQTTHSLLITKKTDINPVQENNIFETSRLFPKTDENGSRNLTLTPFFGQGNRGVKLQPLSSSSNSEGKRNFGNITIKNESSAETDSMGMDFFKKEKLNSGANSTPSTKGFNIDSNLSPLIEIGHHGMNTDIPDINLEIPALPASETLLENLRPSSSRTQSLEMNILPHAEQHKEPKSNYLFNDSDPSNRWVKRLKVSSSNSSSQGTKSLSLGGNLSHEKKKQHFTSALDNCITTSPEPNSRQGRGKEIILSEKNKELSKEDDEFRMDKLKKDRELLLSNVWIKRWLKNGSRNTEEKPDRVVQKVGKPHQNSIVTLRDDDDVQKKQFPSIAAMALMGKAMNGLQSCELQKKGPFTVWYTKAV